METLFRTLDQTTVVEEGPDPTVYGADAMDARAASALARHWDFFGKTSGVNLGPEAYLVEIDAHRFVRAHYHSVDQFQLMYGRGGATYKRQDVPQLFLHYTDAFTTYGPFAAGVESLRFFTLRPNPSTVTAFMPEGREGLPANLRKRRHVLADLSWMIAGYPPTQTGELEVAMADSEGRVLAHSVVSGPGMNIAFPSSPGRGSYLVPLGGAAVDDRGHRFDVGSIGWRAPVSSLGHDGSVVHVGGDLRAGESGCRLLILHF